MKILMLNRATANIVSGGDVVQMEKTREQLQRLGVSVDVSLKSKPNVSPYDLVHVFNVQGGTMPHTFHQISHAKAQGKPVVLSTVYWSHQEITDSVQAVPPASRLPHHWQRLKSLSRQPPGRYLELVQYGLGKLTGAAQSGEQQRKCIQLADRLLPNTQAEAELLQQDLGASTQRITVVPNAADDWFFRPDPEPFVQRWSLRDFVLCVGRVEPRKNQLRLIEALLESRVPLVFIGRQDDHSTYVQQCKRTAGEHVLFIPHLDHHELPAAYAAAKVHVLPSWYETPGIASLEAALAGCNIVTTDRGGTTEYFGEHAYYCDPGDTASIRDAVLAASQAPRSEALSKRVQELYTWGRVGKLTMAVYRDLLVTSPSGVSSP